MDFDPVISDATTQESLAHDDDESKLKKNFNCTYSKIHRSARRRHCGGRKIAKEALKHIHTRLRFNRECVIVPRNFMAYIRVS